MDELTPALMKIAEYRLGQLQSLPVTERAGLLEQIREQEGGMLYTLLLAWSRELAEEPEAEVDSSEDWLGQALAQIYAQQAKAREQHES